MKEPLTHLLEKSVQIAWDYLERTGQIDDPTFVSDYLADRVETLIRGGERNRLVLSNKAIGAFERLK